MTAVIVIVIACRTNVRRFSVKLAGPKLWNSIDIALRTCSKHSIDAFRLAYKYHLTNRY